MQKERSASNAVCSQRTTRAVWAVEGFQGFRGAHKNASRVYATSAMAAGSCAMAPPRPGCAGSWWQIQARRAQAQPCTHASSALVTNTNARKKR